MDLTTRLRSRRSTRAASEPLGDTISSPLVEVQNVFIKRGKTQLLKTLSEENILIEDTNSIICEGKTKGKKEKCKGKPTEKDILKKMSKLKKKYVSYL